MVQDGENPLLMLMVSYGEQFLGVGDGGERERTGDHGAFSSKEDMEFLLLLSEQQACGFSYTG